MEVGVNHLTDRDQREVSLSMGYTEINRKRVFHEEKNDIYINK